MAEEGSGDRRALTRAESTSMPMQYYAEDEISLFDLWDVLVRRRWWMGGVLAVVVLFGLLYAFIRVPVYEYSHAIEIGKRVVGEELRPIESPRSSSAKMGENYLPLAIREWLRDNPDAEWRPEVSASVPADGDIVVLKATGAEARRTAYEEILTSAAAMLSRDHQRIIDTIRQQLSVELTEARNRLDNLKQEASDLESQLGRVERQESLLDEEIEKLESLLDDAEASRQAATGSPSGAADAMTMLMLSNEIRTARQRLSELRVQREIELPDRREGLESRIAEKEGEIEVQKGVVETVRTRLENLSRTQPLSDPQQSLRPVGTGNAVIVALSVVLGGMLGVFVAFFAEFVQAANRRRRDVEAEDSGSES